MQKQTSVVANERRLFYTEAGNDTWSADSALAHKYQNPGEAGAISHLENAFVVPYSC